MQSAADMTHAVEELQARLEQAKADLRDLGTMGAIVTSAQEINAVLSVVMDMAIRLVDGEVGAIMIDEEGELNLKVSWGISDEAIRSLMYHDSMDLPSYSVKAKETIILNELEIHESGINIDSIMAVPIMTSKQCHGVVVIINKSGGGSFGEEDKERLSILLNFVAVSIENSRFVLTQLERQKSEQEMAIAKQIQETILPQNMDQIPGAEIGAVYFPANDVGGDFYDIIQIDDQRFIVIIGDVSNKGVPAALVMSAAAAIIRSQIDGNPDISMSDLTAKLNDLLSNEIIKNREMFVTLFFSKFDLKENVLSYCNAGHLPGLFWDKNTKNIFELGIGGPIVGQFPGTVFKEGRQPLSDGDRLFLFTDGLTEATDDENNLFGRERAEQVFTAEIGLSPNEFCLKVKEWVDRFAEGAAEDTHDDFTILQVKVGHEE